MEVEESIRLQKFLANSGVASRRKCEELILDGKVSVNGQIVKELGTKVNPAVDRLNIVEILFLVQINLCIFYLINLLDM